jgi:hypothetical protein
VARRPKATESAAARHEAPKGVEAPPPAPPTPDFQALFEQLVRRANAGDAEALARLRHFLDRNPDLCERFGDLTAYAERLWTGLMAGDDQLVRESVKRHLARLKAELAGPSPTALEKLLVDQVVVTWLAAQHGETQAASPGGASLAQAAFRLKRAESAQRRHLAAMKTLALLRAALPAGLVPLEPLRAFQLKQA